MTRIQEYLLQNPIDRTQQNPYDEAAQYLDVDREVVRNVWRRLRKSGVVEINEPKNFRLPVEGEFFKGTSEYKEERREDGSVRIQDTVDRKLTDKELFERYGRNDKEWKIISVWFKDKPNGFLLSVHFAPKKADTDLKLQKEFILEIIKKHSPVLEFEYDSGVAGDCLYEIAIPDLHIGKLAWGEEVGEDYDIKIAIERYKEAVEALLSRIDTSTISKILLPVGNDMINVDNNLNTTTAGTPQIGDSRFGKMFLAAKDLLIETIDRLSLIAPVDVVIVAGNHDNLNMFTLGEVLSAWYHNTENVSIDNSPKQRKYYQYGNTGIQFTHGNHEKHLELGLIFATEEAQMWADTKFRFCQLGHFHHTKKTQYVSVEEHQGFQVQVIPSLSSSDQWHYSKGYNALKQAKAFLIHEESGIIGEFTHTV